ncbi:aspartate/glutamate racemase family protein [bacterium]|nr:aspartate/glutamate racemase family protein [bacterium]
MKKDLSNKTVGLIHASSLTIPIAKPFIQEIIPEVQVMHLCDDTIQRDNLLAGVGVIPKINYFKFTTYAHFLEEAKVDLIVLMCSTFNRAVEFARPMINVPMLQIDRPMMELAVKTGKKIGLLATLPTTVPSSERLLRLVAEEMGKEIEIKTVLSSDAFKEIEKGNVEKHNEILLEEIDKLSKEVDCICMAQISMSVLESRLTNVRVPVYNSGRTGFTRVREILESI